MSVVPNEDELKAALVELRAQNPTLGISKLHALLLTSHSDWTVSEKRTRKVLQNEGLVLASANSVANENSKNNVPIPTSSIVPDLDTSKWSSKVEVKYFSKSKGKGLVATEKIAAGEVVWKEDPFILAPEWEIYELQAASAACAYCSTPFNSLPKPSLICQCEGVRQTPSCDARFCNRLCYSRSAKVHPLLCPGQNPASAPLITFTRSNQWQALHAWANCVARLLLSEQRDEAEFKADWNFVKSMAVLGMEERAKGGWLGNAEPDRPTWKKAYELFVKAFQEPGSESERKKLKRLLKKPIRKELADELFGYDGFLRGLGRMSLNLESHGGIYILHSHMNHSCTPTISVRHLDQRTALSKITVLALKDIEPGEELVITYVNPAMPLEMRRKNLLEWGFGTCKCSRCVMEEQDPNRPKVESEQNDLEKELKEGLGVL